MKHLLLSIFFIFLAISASAQDTTTTQQPETFDHEWEGEMVTMQKYFIVFLKSGPSGGDGEIRGFSVYNVPTIEKAIELANNDPMVKAGRLVVEVHPWWLAKGSGVK